MRRIFILLVLLFTFLKLSASVNYIDTLNSSAPVAVSDKTNLPVIILHPESLTLFSSLYSISNPELSIGALKNDSLKSKIDINSGKSKLSAPSQNIKNISQQIKQYGLDSLKQLVKSTTNDSLKSLLYTEIARRYLDYDTISDKKKRIDYEIEALNYSMKALHQYSAHNDTNGLRLSFDNLAKVYFSQKRYPQAKWFILQSNTLSRAKNDVPNVITSLLILSAIKSEIKDYKLAKNDLDEALHLSIVNHYQNMELDVLKDYALLYSRLQDYPKEALMLKRRDSLEESIHKKEQARLLAKVAQQDSIQKKKLDSLQNKKKVYITNTKKLYKNSSYRKTTLL